MEERGNLRECAFSNNERMCVTLDRAGVPRDGKWRSLVLYMRSLKHHDTLTTRQRAQLQLLLLGVMKEKNYSEDNFQEILRKSDQIFSAPYVEKIEGAVRESQKLLDEFQSIIRTRRGDLKTMEEDSARAVASGREPSEVISHLRFAFKKLIMTMDEDVERLDRLCHTDSLTGLNNRRAFDEFLQNAVLAAAKEGRPISLILFDIDHFKRFNDQYGHRVGDQALTAVAKVVDRVLNVHPARRPAAAPPPFAARYGGEEFAIVAPGWTEEDAAFLAEEIRQAVASYNFLIRTEKGEVVQKGITITASFGVGTLAEYQNWSRDIAMLVEAADAALYQAKGEGRNRVAIGGNVESSIQAAVN